MALKSHGRKSITASLKPRSLMDDSERLAGVWMAQVITLLPQAFPGLLGESLTGKALRDGLWQLDTVNLRDHGLTKHRNVDDTPAGGGAGMVLRADVMGAAIEEARARAPFPRPIYYLSPRGPRFDQQMARTWARGPGVTLICGRFEGLDERVLEHYGIREVSLGDFVMTGGEPAAMAMLDATVRLLPGVLGNAASTEEESFADGMLEHPQYTKPADWQGREIPPTLMSGNHGEIARWRQEMSERLTRARRPDLWAARREALLDDDIRAVHDAASLAAFLDGEAPELAVILRNRPDLALPTDPWRAIALLMRLARD
ncbi:MAG: tRNA (guanosine(37)-N1)-methyltransferase TrmD [Rhodobacteraceae bacterium]|nr:tRNA (guanosine(37)-N1)-methyltransferase TrmD [Paracoccaceae bacterium]MBR9820299.1 tRNA (guanosine(37)-N1)-methyltransferase TrmD [Paracoccaceae bacterium]